MPAVEKEKKGINRLKTALYLPIVSAPSIRVRGIRYTALKIFTAMPDTASTAPALKNELCFFILPPAI
jgi:hypothetical protein